jgi:hypothetical protein
LEVPAFFAIGALGIPVLRILADYFRERTSPGLILYAEYIAASLPAGRSTTDTIASETEKAFQVVLPFFPNPDFLAVAAGDRRQHQPHPSVRYERGRRSSWRTNLMGRNSVEV